MMIVRLLQHLINHVGKRPFLSFRHATDNQWIGLTEHLPENPRFNRKIDGFPFRFSLTTAIKPMN